MSKNIPDIRIVIAVPTAGMVHWRFATSLTTLITTFSSARIQEFAGLTCSLRLDFCESSNWITNREKLAKRAVETNATHLMFLDDDMVFEPDVLEIMLKRHQHVVVTNYLMKTDPPTKAGFTSCGLDGQEVETTEESSGIQPVAFSGFGVSLIDVSVLKEIEQPWFMPRFVAEEDEYTTEDVPFFQKVRDKGIPVFLDHDASKKIQHIGRKFWGWHERGRVKDQDNSPSSTDSSPDGGKSGNNVGVDETGSGAS